MAHVQAAAAMEAAHDQKIAASHSGLLDSALDVTATVEARFGLQTNPSLILSTFITSHAECAAALPALREEATRLKAEAEAEAEAETPNYGGCEMA